MTIPLDRLYHYVLNIVNGKFVLKEVSGENTGRKIVKISGKKLLSSGRVHKKA
jgi:ribosomal protein S4E